MLTVVRALLLAALLTFVPVGIGIAVSADPTPEAPASAYAGSTLSDTPVSGLAVRRAAFCARIHPEAVLAAVGGESEPTTWDNGETADLPSGEDVAHEYGCSYAATAGESGSAVRAQAWVFAPPVTGSEARKLVADVPKGCAAQPSAPAYGAPSLALLCTTGSTREASYRGLFGDAWLTCSLTVPAGTAGTAGTTAEELAVRASRWCVAVAQAAATG